MQGVADGLFRHEAENAAASEPCQASWSGARSSAGRRGWLSTPLSTPARRVVPQEAVEPGHAKAAIDAGVVDDVAPLDEIAPRLRYL